MDLKATVSMLHIVNVGNTAILMHTFIAQKLFRILC